MQHKVIIDTDPGIDDFLAIVLAQQSTAIDILALTTVFGNVDLYKTTNNAYFIRDQLRANFQIYSGAQAPLISSLITNRDSSMFHGSDGMGNLNIPMSQDQNSVKHHLSAAEFIVQAARQNEGELSIITLGAMTNLALALKLEPHLPKMIRQVVCMAGAVQTQGNATPAAEFNVWTDPYASDLVVSSGFNLTLIGLDVTQKVVLDDSFLEQLNVIKKPFIPQLIKSLVFYSKAYKQHVNPNGFHCHDPSAILYLTHPELFETISGVARVITEGIGAGQVLMDRKGHSSQVNAWANLKPIKVAVKVNSMQLVQTLLQTIEHG